MVQLLFLRFLLFIVLVVLLFRLFYMLRDTFYYYFFFILLIFVFRIGFLVIRKTALHVLLGWDLLGVTSFFLVLYYSNWDRCTGAIRTILVNRLGDFFIFLGFSVRFFVRGFLIYGFLGFFFLIFFVVASFTKSAQFPFSGWLPKAMRAPTPVSSLVHRRTLVTAGLFLIFGFSFLRNILILSYILLMFGLFTILFSNFLAVYEKDVKKVVALRTMSQIGFCMFSLGLCFYFLTYFHVTRHAFFKSCLFMQVGFMIYRFFGQQDVRGYSQYCWRLGLVQFQFLCCLVSLCGIFFLGGLLSKDFIIEYVFISGGGLIFFFLFILILWMTFVYSYLVYFGLFFFGRFFYMFYYGVIGVFSTVLLYLCCLFLIRLLINNSFFMLRFFLYLDILFWGLYIFLFIFLLFFGMVSLFKIIYFKFLGDFFFF